MKTGTGNPPVPPRARFRGVSARFGHSGQFRPVRDSELKKKKKKGPNDAVLDLSKYLAQTLFFHLFTLTFTLKSSLPSCSLPLLCSLNHSTLSYSAVSDSLTVSLSRIEQPRYSFSTLTLSDSSFSSASAKSFFFFPYDLLCG